MNIDVIYGILAGIAVGFLFGAVSGGSFFFFRNKAQIAIKSAEIAVKEAEFAQLNVELSGKIGELRAMQTQKSEVSLVSKQLSDRFEALAAKIFDEKSSRFSEQSLKNLNILLDPFKERLKDFEKKVDESYSTERTERGTLRGEISKLIELNVKMSSETHNLTKALKGDNKTMGNWGELILENILDRSGLRRGEEYILQGTDLGLKNELGQSIRPDVIINLPEGKHIIIDAKVTLTAYEAYVNSERPEQKEVFGKQHLDSLKRHIDGLSAKKYSSADKLISPDFVILFLPIEPAFALAFKLKPDLLEYSWERNIAIVSPTTLLTTLKTVSALWKTERQQRNAMEIARRGGALYDKFASLVEDLQELGEKIESTQKTHALVMNKISQGNGNLLRQVDLLKELGAKTEKRIQLDTKKADALEISKAKDSAESIDSPSDV